MSAAKTIDKDRLLKLVAHLDNDNEHEMLTALRFAKKVLGEFGFKFIDLPKIFDDRKPQIHKEVRPWNTPKHTDSQRQAAADDYRRRAEAEKARKTSERREAELRERCKQETRDRLKSDRDAVIAKYGSVDAAYRKIGLERSVHIAFSLAMHEQQRDRARDGRFDEDFEVQRQKDLVDAVRKPGPFPRTITAAHAEVQYWNQRAEDLLMLEWNEGRRNLLSSGCALRQKMVQDAFRFGLRSTCLAEVLLRQRAIIERHTKENEDLEKAIFTDLEHLAAQAAANLAPTEMSSKQGG